MATSDRAAALARLAELGAKPELGVSTTEPKVERTGDEVYAGGDEARFLVRDAHLTYREGGELLHAFAVPGDTVLLTAAQAKRLDGLGVTEPVKAKTAKAPAPAAPAPAAPVDEQAAKFAAMGAEELVAHVNQFPEDKAKVRELELERKTKRRKSVLEATADPNGDDPDEELDEE